MNRPTKHLVRQLTRAGLVAVLSMLPAACIFPMPAKTQIERTGEMRQLSDPIGVAIVFSRDFATATSNSLGHAMVKCITDGLAAAAPDVRLLSSRELHRALFDVEPGGVLLRADTLPTLLARSETRERAREAGVTHVVLVAGATESTGTAGGGAAAGYGAGAAIVWSSGTRTTQLTASVFDIGLAGDAAQLRATASGDRFATAGLVVLPFLVAGIPRTEALACRALGAELAQTLRRGGGDDRK